MIDVHSLSFFLSYFLSLYLSLVLVQYHSEADGRVGAEGILIDILGLTGKR